jgi:hypothetical protein
LGGRLTERQSEIRWTVGDQFLDIVSNEIATIIAVHKRRIFAEWRDGSRDWISRGDLREIWATSFAE